MPKDNKPKGKTSAYAFFVKQTREDFKKAGKNYGFGEMSVKISEKWKQVSDEDKKRFNKMAAQDKLRYEREMQNWTPPAGQKGKGAKRKKDPNAPKRAMSGFMFFSQKERSTVKEENPDFGIGEIAKELGTRWKGMTDKDKKVYETMAKKDRDRYESEMTAYRQNHKGGSPSKKQKVAAKPSAKSKKVVEEEEEDDEDEEEEEEEEEDEDEEEEDDEEDDE